MFKELTNSNINSLIEAIPDAVYFKDSKLRNLAVNGTFEKLLRLSKKDILGKKDEEILPRNLADQCRKSDEQVLREKKSIRVEEKMVDENGKVLFFDTIKFPIFDENHKIAGLCGISRDVTYSKQMEEELKEREAELRRALDDWQRGFDAMNDLLFQIDSDFTITRANLSVSKFLNMPIADIIGSSCCSLMHGHDYPIEGCPLERAKKTKKREDTELYLADKDMWVSVTVDPILDEEGNLVTAMHAIRDITEMKVSEKELRDSKLRFQAVANYTYDWESWHDADGRLLWVNPAVERLTGYSVERCLAMENYPLPMIHKDDSPNFEIILREAAAKRSSGNDVLFRIVRAEGAIRWAAISWQSIFDTDGKCIGFRTSVRDITERKRAEEELDKYRQHLEDLVDDRTKDLRNTQEQLMRREKLAVLGQLAGSVAHELRNPLGAINNAIYLLKSLSPEEHERNRRYIDMASKSVVDAERIISDLLGLSRMKAGSGSTVNVANLIAQTLNDMTVPIGIDVSLEIPQDLLLAPVDPQQIAQVFANLISNACQAMPDGGKLVIAGTKSGGEACIAFRDDGCGITEESMTNLFEPLFTTKAKGIGLGLVVSKNLVEINGGRIEVESKEGKGSTFTVILPIRVSDN